MLHRVSKENDVNKDKWIGVGGHFEKNESPEECLLREVYEETGLLLTSWRYRGIVTFIFEDDPAEYMSLYTAEGFEGSVTNPDGTMRECDEGVLAWVKKSDIDKLNLWEGGQNLLPASFPGGAVFLPEAGVPGRYSHRGGIGRKEDQAVMQCGSAR